MKNIHVLPTPNPSRLYEFGNQFNIQDKEQENFRSFNIHITNNEEIKDSEIDTKVCIFKSDNSMITCLAGKGYGRVKTIGKYYEIILTTDQDLIKDGVQAIDDEFLEWFVNNPSCEMVEVLFACRGLDGNTPIGEYRIIIPKEETKQEFPTVNGSYGCTIPIKDETKQETLEEVAKNYASKKLQRPLTIYYPLESNVAEYVGFINGAKWQQEQDKNKYSEEEVEDLIYKVCGTVARLQGITLNGNHIDTAYKKFKKK